ncbi:hypothetical protein [Kineosporia sp. NBRC 101731]|uniref:hypothetical protein n=1 Tax=Kineosporia sp. NBRC 101731 TaxID=3032199 RepID=UPI0024A07638|nr:hypothetical protein [Kineosporia sp. NBRC 101731]GLY32510.1 hypothetical protein Kisp02_58750 [Kineosporia sp. NBRC 101731]
MSIDTTIEGDPQSIRTLGLWIEKTFTVAVGTASDDYRTARDRSERSWEGDAASAFHTKVDSAQSEAFTFELGIESYGKSLVNLADDLKTAKTGMERVREMAREDGLLVDGNTIIDPRDRVAPDMVPGRVLPPATDEQRSSELNEQIEAYEKARREVDKVFDEYDMRKASFTNVSNDLRDKKWIVVATFANDTLVELMAGAYGSKLAQRALQAQEMIDLAHVRHVRVPMNGPYFGDSLKDLQERYSVHAKSMGKVGQWGRVSKGLPVIGWGLVATDIGYDITHEKPVDKTLVSASTGLGVGAAAGAVGSALGTAAAGALVGGSAGSVVPIAGTIVGAVVGAGAGLVAGGMMDSAYDRQHEKDETLGRGGSTHVNMIKEFYAEKVVETKDEIVDKVESTVDDAVDKLTDPAQVKQWARG